MGFPKQVAPFVATFENVGDPDETLKIQWTYPLGVPGNKQFIVGIDSFLEDPAAAGSMQFVPDEHLIASLSMCAILAGEILPGTAEFMAAIGDALNFQTIVGNVKLKSAPVPVSDITIGPEGTVYDLEFMRVGQSTNVKVVRADVWSICQYSNRVDSAAHSAPVVVGAIHKQFGFKKSQLGPADSANRQAVVDFVASQRFWI